MKGIIPCKCSLSFVFYHLFVRLSLCQRQRLPKIRTFFCLFNIKKRSFLTSCVFGFGFLNASNHLCFCFCFFQRNIMPKMCTPLCPVRTKKRSYVNLLSVLIHTVLSGSASRHLGPVAHDTLPSRISLQVLTIYVSKREHSFHVLLRGHWWLSWHAASK